VTKWYEFASDLLHSKLIKANSDLQHELDSKLDDNERRLSETQRLKSELEQSNNVKIYELQDKVTELKMTVVEMEKCKGELTNNLEKMQIEKSEVEERIKKAVKLEKEKLEKDLKKLNSVIQEKED